MKRPYLALFLLVRTVGKRPETDRIGRSDAVSNTTGNNGKSPHDIGLVTLKFDKIAVFVYNIVDKHMNIIRVSISEAARLFGVSGRTVRRAITVGELTYVVVRGRYKISFESLVRWSQKRPTVRNKLASEGIGQFVSMWKIRNRLYSPNPKLLEKGEQGDKV